MIRLVSDHISNSEVKSEHLQVLRTFWDLPEYTPHDCKRTRVSMLLYVCRVKEIFWKVWCLDSEMQGVLENGYYSRSA